jgi:Tfp pilus assembly protein PilF
VIDSVTELSDYPSRTLYSTWDMSFAKIQQQNGRAAHLLMFLAYLDNRDIWHDLLYHCQSDDQPGWFAELAGDEFVFEDAMQTLTRYCLVESQYQTGSYSLHVCVHDWTMDGLNHDIDVTQYWLAVDCVHGHVGNLEWSDLSGLQHRRLNVHAERLLHDRFREAVNASTLSLGNLERLDTIAGFLSQQVQHRAAERMYFWALAGCEQALGPEHTSTLSTVNNLGNLYADQGKLDQAEAMYERALAGREQALGPEHTWTLSTVNNLGNLYADQGKLDQAEAMYERTPAGNKKASLSETIPALNTIRNLGLLYRDQGNMKDAKIMFQRALLGRDKVLGPGHNQTLKVINDFKGAQFG